MGSPLFFTWIRWFIYFDWVCFRYYLIYKRLIIFNKVAFNTITVFFLYNCPGNKQIIIY